MEDERQINWLSLFIKIIIIFIFAIILIWLVSKIINSSKPSETFKNNINNIELVNLSDSVTTMYPMLNDNFEEIASAVKINGSTQNITYSADSKYTSSMILSGIKAALDKAVVTGAK